MLTILIGMSASGKDAILRELVANHGFREIVTTTTRPMRKGEVNGKDYNFISRKEFEKGISEGRFFEYRSYNTIWNGKEDVQLLCQSRFQRKAALTTGTDVCQKSGSTIDS